ncbi:hypothetical protein PGT21_025615 [Puccinia graminis f. sp. tritici]|uniref:Uncharacterized protein n=1 Tax=Puccinia graminis f. sp. tritici TaxID=56615 RepID=A0A5B0NM83_PUCGR|nr:hypothetical protein PGT21_025615 [Puccinia graminis f. sp. tritici]
MYVCPVSGSPCWLDRNQASDEIFKNQYFGRFKSTQMRLDNIIHNSTGSQSHYSGTDWVDSALDNLPLTPLTNTMTPVDDSFEFLDANGQRCRHFPAGPNQTVAYTTMQSSVHQSYGPVNDPQAAEAQCLAAQEFRNMYVNPNRSILTPSSTSVNTHPSEGSHSPSFNSSPARSHLPGRMSELHQSNVVDISNRFHPYPSFGTTSQATPKQGAQMANPERTPRGPRLISSTRVVNHSTSPAGLSNVLDLDDEIGLLQDQSRLPLDDDQQSTPPSPLPDRLDASVTFPEERTIMIDFHFHLPIASNPPSSRKKKNGGVDIPKTRVYKSEVGKVTICWDLSNTDLVAFKSAVITAIVTNEEKRLTRFVERRESLGHITWYGSIHHGGPFAATKNKQLVQPGVFSAWLAACREVANKDRTLTCKLDQTDPRALAERAAALDGLDQLENPGTSTEPGFQPSSAAIDRAKINEYIGLILATYSPRPRLSGSSDKSVFINPENNQEYFVISMRVAEAWGKAMHLTPATVDLRTPPKTPMFDYITGPLESDGPPPTTIPQQPAPPYPYPPYPHGYPPMMGYPPHYPFHGAAPATQGLHPTGGPSQDAIQGQHPPNQQPESSPAPSDNEGDGDNNITAFLLYARVDPNSSAVRDGMADLGITHWSMFRHVKSSELMDAGVPMGPARTIVVAAKRYSDRLKSRARARAA